MLDLQPTKGLGPNQFTVFENNRRIGRIYKTSTTDGWFWGVDWFAAGQEMIGACAATREHAFAEFKTAWKRLQAKVEFKTAWEGVPRRPRDEAMTNP
jgi:hypothetical protein